jgi:hypothetical protein
MIRSYFLLATILASPAVLASPQTAKHVDLGSAAHFAVLAKSGISTTGTTSVVGDIGVSPMDSTGMTGFGLVMDASGTFSTSSLLVGKATAANYTVPTPANLTASVADMEAAYTDAAGRAPDFTDLGAGNIGGMTLAPGVYKWGTGLTIPTDVTLSGGPAAIWIFQVAGTLTTSSGTAIVLSGGATPGNVYWQVAGQTTLGTTSSFKGIILDQTAIVMNTGATLDGRALAQTAVTLDGNTVNGQVSSTLIDNLFNITSTVDPSSNVGSVGVSGGEFRVFGDVTGVGTANQAVRIHYDAPQPTGTSRSDKAVSVKQSSFSTIEVFLDNVSVTGGPLVIDKCSVNGTANVGKLTGSIIVRAKLDTLFALLTPSQIESIRTAFDAPKSVMVKVSNNSLTGSMWIHCDGAAVIN